MATRLSFRQRLTNSLITSLEETGQLPWLQIPSACRPFNPVSGVKYKGGNSMGLLLEQTALSSHDPRWMTLKQANSAGYAIRKNAKASYVEYWDWGLPELHGVGKKGEEEAESEVEKPRKPRLFYAAVFNGIDVVDLPEYVSDTLFDSSTVEVLLMASEAQVEHVEGGNTSYSRSSDTITLPMSKSFKDIKDYYATVIRGLSYWSGHPSRLNRAIASEDGLGQARETLRAEIAAFYLSAALGIDGGLPGHEKHADQWIELIRQDKHEIFRAARDAELIVDHLLDYAPELREQMDSRLSMQVLEKNTGANRIAASLGTELPNFVPANSAISEVPRRIGRNDLRWPEFERAILAMARKYGLQDSRLEPIFEIIEPNFSEIMDGMSRKGLETDMVYEMIGRQIVEEMQQTESLQSQFDAFASQVRAAAADLVGAEALELALQDINRRYQQVLVDGANARWGEEQTQQALDSVLWGGNQSRTIDEAFIRGLVGDMEEYLAPLGMPEIVPDDVGALDDELIARP